MPLIADLVLNASGSLAGYFGTEGSIALPETSHVAGSGLYTVQFLTKKEIRTSVPAVVTITLVDDTKRALSWKLKAPVAFNPFSFPDKFLYQVQFTIEVTQIDCRPPEPLKTVPADPSKSILILVIADEFDEGEKCD